MLPAERGEMGKQCNAPPSTVASRPPISPVPVRNGTCPPRASYEVVGTFKETVSGVRLDRIERKRVLALVQRREIDAVLVTELSRWGSQHDRPSGNTQGTGSSSRLLGRTQRNGV